MNLTFQFDEIIGKIKPMHAVGQPPMMGKDCTRFQYLQDASVPYSRLHDVGGPYGQFRYVDIPNIFREFDADETDPASYDFAFTDYLIENLYKYNCAPIFRLGVTIENEQSIKPYRIYPPKDFHKWARICEHIIRHYNEGWADGFHYGIVYWEIWNEPDGNLPGLNEMWIGTDEEFYELYDISAKHLKACFGDTIKIGGGACSSFLAIFTEPEKYGYEPSFGLNDFTASPQAKHMLEFFFEFLDYVKKHNSPMDFFPWHSYDTVQEVEILSDFLHETLENYGLGHVETQLNEWNNARTVETRGTAYAASNACAMMCAMQNKKERILCYYDARVGHSVYGGMFHPITYKPFCTYYAFFAFGELYRLGNQTAAEGFAENVYGISAADGEKHAVLLTNISDEDKDITTNLEADMKCCLLDEDCFLEEVKIDVNNFVLKKNQTVLLKNY